MQPLILMILDGFGHSTELEHNAIALGNTPHFKNIWSNYPHTLLEACGSAVGLPDKQMGNSEVGHLTIGAGRVIAQSLVRINESIDSGDFFKQATLNQKLQHLKAKNQALHLMGLLSDGGVHSHDEHLFALMKLAKQQGLSQVYIHAILDGRDTPPKSAKKYLAKLEKRCQALSLGKIASICGRYYAMDRDKRLERTQAALDLYVKPHNTNQKYFEAKTAFEALDNAYAREETDEFVTPTRIIPQVILPADGVLFFNFRADRARQIIQALASLPNLALSDVIGMTDYQIPELTHMIFPPLHIKNTLGEIFAHHQLKQLRLAETEKYAHVTYFFNGGKEVPFAGEERLLIPSPKVATYDLKPEMSAIALTDALIEQIKSQKFDVIICNYANPDMVGHTGNLTAAIQACEVIDKCLGQVLKTVKNTRATLLITADHGNVECMQDNHSSQPHTAHTLNPVPFILVNEKSYKLAPQGALADIAPTLLALMGMPLPKEMTGKPLLS